MSLSVGKCLKKLPFIIDRYIRDATDENGNFYDIDKYVNVKAYIIEDSDEKKEDGTCDVLVLKTKLSNFIVTFNNTFQTEFEEWYENRIFGDKRNKCVYKLTINEVQVVPNSIDATTLTIADKIISNMKKSCFPFISYHFMLVYGGIKYMDEETGILKQTKIVSHATKCIIEFDKSLKNVKMTYFNPHGSLTTNLNIDMDDILLRISKHMKLKGINAHYEFGCEITGIQEFDKIGLCNIFSRFWLFISLQLMKLCKTTFKGNMTREIEIYTKKTLDKKLVNVIVYWMYKMILTMLDDTSGKMDVNMLGDIMFLECQQNISNYKRYINLLPIREQDEKNELVELYNLNQEDPGDPKIIELQVRMKNTQRRLGIIRKRIDEYVIFCKLDIEVWPKSLCDNLETYIDPELVNISENVKSSIGKIRRRGRRGRNVKKNY